MRILYLPNSHCQQRQFEKPDFLAYPVLMAMEAEWYRKRGHEVFWGGMRESGSRSRREATKTRDSVAAPPPDKIITEPEGLPFLSLPHPDRIFTKAKDKIYQRNGNFKYHPGTYIMSASGCWHGKCTFCVENGKPYEVREVADVWQEIEECYALGFKEIFDDSATFPTGGWLDEFCSKIMETKFRGVRYSCNMRLVDIDYKRLFSCGFRMLLFGLESANQSTLDKINKGVKVEDYKYIIKAAKAGLEPHIAVMFGYPWENEKDAINTLKLVWWLLRKGYTKTAQASFYIPFPGYNPEIEYGIEYDGWDEHIFRKYTRKIYGVWKYPNFWFNKLRDIHNIADLKYFWRQIKDGLNNYTFAHRNN